MRRSFVIDLLKIVAAQVIVLHHLSSYGPAAPALAERFPGLLEFLFEYGRMAVQVFLVIGGFLAARSLERRDTIEPARMILTRYLRLVPVYLIALAIITAVVTASRATIGADWLPDRPEVSHVLTHALLLHGVFGHPSLSTGVWYVAIDLQLYTMFTLISFVAWRRTGTLREFGLPLLVLAILGASLFVFNRDAGLDDWGIYFFGAYGLGVMAARARRGTLGAVFFGIALVVATLAFWVEPRARLALALATALVLAMAADTLTPSSGRGSLRARLADSSYELFLVHFALVVLASAAWSLLGLEGPVAATLTFVTVWAASVVSGLLLHEAVEVPLQRWISAQSSFTL